MFWIALGARRVLDGVGVERGRVGVFVIARVVVVVVVFVFTTLDERRLHVARTRSRTRSTVERLGRMVGRIVVVGVVGDWWEIGLFRVVETELLPVLVLLVLLILLVTVLLLLQLVLLQLLLLLFDLSLHLWSVVQICRRTRAIHPSPPTPYHWTHPTPTNTHDPWDHLQATVHRQQGVKRLQELCTDLCRSCAVRIGPHGGHQRVVLLREGCHKLSQTGRGSCKKRRPEQLRRKVVIDRGELLQKCAVLHEGDAVVAAVGGEQWFKEGSGVELSAEAIPQGACDLQGVGCGVWGVGWGGVCGVCMCACVVCGVRDRVQEIEGRKVEIRGTRRQVVGGRG